MELQASPFELNTWQAGEKREAFRHSTLEGKQMAHFGCGSLRHAPAP
jgi:hypothetical protein